MNAQQQIDWYEIETKAHEAVDALEKATKLVFAEFNDPDKAHFIETKRAGDVIAAHVRLAEVVQHLTGGKSL